MAGSECWVLTLLVVIGLILLLLRVKWRWPSPAAPRAQPNAKPTPRPLKPRTPDDCPACRAAQPGLPPVSSALKPYSQVKSLRGRRKHIVTAGYACPNPDCAYCGIPDEHIHALVGYGGHGRQEYIQDLKCQAWRLFQNLKPLHIQLDELCTKTRHEAEALWVWFAVDARTKVIAVLKDGPRTQPVAHAVVHDLVNVLAADCLPVFTSDGLKLYFYALTAHFGKWVETAGQQKRQWQVPAELLYGQLIKHYRRRRLVRVERRALLGSLDQLQATLHTFGW
jgi:hypothetical protein